MKAYRNLGVERKMELMTLLICGAVLLVAVAALFLFQVLNFRSSFQRDNMTLATIIAHNSTAAMQFKDEQAANEAIRSLQVKPGLIAASLVLPDGTLFAHFGVADDAQMRSQYPAPGESRFVKGQLLLTQPVSWKAEEVGTLYLRSDYEHTFTELLKFYGMVIAGVVLVAIFLGVILSRRLSRTIIDPVLELARTAQIVGKLKDYSLRALVDERGDELGILTRAFNEMLSHIQSQDAALNVSQQKLQTLLNSMQALVNSIDGIVWERSPESFLFTFVSRQSETILGYAPEAWLKEPEFWATKLHPQDAARAIKASTNLASQGKSYTCEYRMLAADGRVLWIRESGMAIYEDGRPIAIRGILLDITRQKDDADQLDKLNRQLINTSRQAGMADVATGVLHNVGNVLNSVSVATSKVGERLQRSKIPNLRRATAMLREKNGELAEFLTTDPQGKLLPEYLNSVADQLAEEQEELLTKVKTVAVNIEHIKEIVSMQQNYAKVSGAYENLQPVQLVEDALNINMAALDRHGIDVRRDFADDLPAIHVDRHKVLQILVNVLSNAKYAMEELDPGQKRMVIAVNICPKNQIAIVVQDNGVGIPAENMTKIFNHGFTTKKNGHGFGLHSAANAAKEIGGSLIARSDGPGKGAEFTLRLPIAEAQPEVQPLATSAVS